MGKKKKQPLPDPLRILREDTFTDDETNEMVGRMHRKQYADSQNKKSTRYAKGSYSREK
jgi:hypothetical protein